MRPKIIGIIAILAGLALLATIVYFFFFANKTEVNTPAGNKEINTLNTGSVTKSDNNNTVPVQEAQKTSVVPVKKTNPEKFSEEDLKKMALLFAERFGSFSNQSNFRNISDLKIFMSESMQKWADDYIKEQNEKMADNSIYYGIITKAVTTEVRQLDEAAGQAAVMVGTRRRETAMLDSNSSDTYNQDILISFVKENNLWKVNNAYWQSK